MRKVLRDEQTNKTLVEKGYIQKQLLSATEIRFLLDEIRKICPESDFSPHGDASSHPYIFGSYMQSAQKIREIGSTVVKPVVLPYIEQLLDNYQLISCGLFIKAPKGGWFDIHYHPTVVADLKHWVINVWCPLRDTDVSNGTFHAVPGSHKIFPEIIPHNYVPFYRDYTTVIREKYSVALPAKAGEAVIFEDTLLHWSPNNMTDYPRYAIHCACVPKEAETVYVYSDPRSPQQFELYSVNEEFFVNSVFGGQGERPTNLKLLSVVPNTNRSYTLEMFEEQMQNAEQVRQALYPEYYAS